jgi:Domain of unknown function (DUF4276)
MRCLYLYVEGATELTFADLVLKPHLATFEVFVEIMRAEHGRTKGKIHKGGVTRYAPFQRGLRTLLKTHAKRPDVTVSTMIDLYALPHDFPGWERANELRNDPYQRVECLEQELAQDIEPNVARFVPYVQLHEYEALLFADITKLGTVYPDQQAAVEQLSAIARAQPNPELINDGPQTAPSKRIIAQIPDYEGAKVVFGSQVAESIGLVALRARCKHFNDWVAKLECLGQPPIPEQTGE